MKRFTRWTTAAALLAAAVPVLSLAGCDDGAETPQLTNPPAATSPTTQMPPPTGDGPATATSTTTPSAAAPVATPSTSAAAAATTAAAADPAATSAATARAQEVVDKAVAYLKAQQQPDGGWQNEKEPPAITAIALKAIAAARPDDAKAEYVKKGFDRLVSFQVENGGIYKDLLANYNTAIAVSALAEANDPAYKPQLDKAVTYLRGLQWTPDTRPEYIGKPGEKVPEQNAGKQVVKDENDAFFGGWGYGGRSRGAGRPDLSNAQLAIEALKEAGLKEDDPAFRNAIRFVTRQQNNSETNDRPWAGDDGGFVYGPADNGNGESQAGEYKDESGERRLRSYGSMTYAGLKSMIYAGLKKDDPRVKAAWDWITKNWSLDENPGMRLNKPEAAKQGLYYYYHTLAKALNAYDEPTIVDPQGKRHDWRVELVDKLASLQKPDGSWAGDKKWMEDNGVLTTSYVVIALQEALEDMKEHPGK